MAKKLRNLRFVFIGVLRLIGSTARSRINGALRRSVKLREIEQCWSIGEKTKPLMPPRAASRTVNRDPMESVHFTRQPSNQGTDIKTTSNVNAFTYIARLHHHNAGI